MQSLVCVNGEVLSPENAKVSVMDRGFLFGDGVYEAGRSYDRVFLYLEEHWERLRRSAAKLRIPVPWTDEQLQEDLFRVARAFGKTEMCFRTIVTRGMVDVVRLDDWESLKPTLVHVVQGLSPKFAQQQTSGIFLLTSKIHRNSSLAQDPNIKTSNYLNCLLAAQDIRDRGGDEGVLCDPKGNVTEGTNFSIFAVRESEQVVTPSLSVGILDSITRRHVLELARELFPVEEGIFSLNDFQNCREVFIVSSTREIVPVHTWDGNKYPAAGPVTAKLQEKLKAEIATYTKMHPKF